MNAVSSYSDKVGDEPFRSATGKTAAEWHAILDGAGASEWEHARIARWVVSEYAVGDWWAQGISVSYEQHIGRRVPGQRQDGTFEVSTSATFHGDNNLAVLHAVRATVEKELGEADATNVDAKYPTARWKLPDGETVRLMADPSANGKVVASITWAKMQNANQMVAAKTAMRGWLASSVVDS